MVIDVIISNSSKAVDKAFSYAVPAELCDEIEIGRRVIVPFARGNREIEGYCVGIHPDKAAKGLKSVMYVADEQSAFDERLLEVIEYMHERYLCSYCEIINAIVPAGTGIKMREFLVLNCEDELIGVRAKIAEELKNHGGEMERHELYALFETGISSTISSMVKAGELKREFRPEREIKERKVKALRPLEISEEAMEQLIKTAPAQAKIINYLQLNGVSEVSEVLRETEASRGSIMPLEKKGYVEIFELVKERDPFADIKVEPTEPMEPTEQQAQAIRTICKSADEGTKPVLLHGVTGSGKTEVFLQSIAHVLEQGKTALVLVPEISLTPQMVSRFLARFSSRVAVIHSGLSKGERFDQWRRIYNGEADIVIGARSAVFAPLDNIGIIIMDEEHSESYKSDMSPRYHAREIALKRSQQYGAALVLASATPLVESYYKASEGEYELVSMTKRVNEAKLPPIHIADMRDELAEGNRSMFSRELYREMKRNIEKGEQTILFLNRRGFSTFVSCRSCGYTVQCPNCNISMTYHKFDNLLKCHYCGYTTRNYTLCPECGSKYIRYFGGGTQRVEEEVHKIFPGATTIRMDVDTTGKKQSHEKLLESFDKEKINVLIGTQMVAKGLDFENVTLVGVVSADTMLHMNDFRSSERTFSMLEQVTGRAGRGEKAGRAIVQTYSPDAEAISLASAHDYYNFCKGEIEIRKLMWYPPFSKLIVVLFSGAVAKNVSWCAAYFKKYLGDLKELDENVQVLGPVASSVSKINNKYRYQMIIKCSDDDAFNERLKKAMDACRKHTDYEQVTIVIDKNPTMV